MSAPLSELARTIEALLFLSPEPVAGKDLMEACLCDGEDFDAALAELREAFAPGARGLELKEVAGGLTLASSPAAEEAARRLLAKPRTPPLTPAQAETLSIVAYLQPVSRPEITRIRGVSADSAAATLLERGLVEEAGRSPFGAVLYRTTPLFLKLFGLSSVKDLPDVAQWDPTPEEQADLRDRLLKAGEARAGGPAAPPQPGEGDADAGVGGSDDIEAEAEAALAAESAPVLTLPAPAPVADEPDDDDPDAPPF